MITQELVRSVFDYRDGHLYWKVRTSNRIKIGDRVGSPTPFGYSETSLFGKGYLVHRLIYLFHKGWMPDVLDHADNNPSNSRIENLRPATPSQNQHNRSLDPRNTSGVKGVYWNKERQKWQAHICFKGRIRSLGRYDDLNEAARVVQAERERLHGEFARHE